MANGPRANNVTSEIHGGDEIQKQRRVPLAAVKGNGKSSLKVAVIASLFEVKFEGCTSERATWISD